MMLSDVGDGDGGNLAASTSFCGGGEAQPQSNMVVAVRIRPLSAKEHAAGAQKCCKVINKKMVVISKAGIAGSYLRSQQGSVNEYGFDVAFDDSASQAEVYEGTAKKHVPAVLEGYNVTVFAYGATGAGKTHTMMGSERSQETYEEDPHAVSGIIPMSLVDIFAALQHRRADRGASSDKEHWSVAVSYLEVYNEQIYDLLGPGRQPLAVREDAQKGVVQVAGLSEMDVQNTTEVLELLRQGNRHRKTESTAANVVSSRSHAVLQVWVRFRGVGEFGNDVVRESRLSLIDLAGSERASATQNRGARLQEGANINKSLLALANCINALADNGAASRARRNVKYRDSKLTHLLKTSLEGDCRVIMIANVNPSHLVHEDSHNTLKYANRAKCIKIKPGTSHLLTQEVPWHVREARLRADNESLRQQLAELRGLLGRAPHASELSPIAESSIDSSLRRRPGGGKADPNEVANTSISSSSFMTSTSVDDGMDVDAFASISHDTEAQLERGLLKLPAAQLESPQLSAIGTGDNESVIHEMTRTRQFMQRLIESLQAQKDEKDRDLQRQRKMCDSLQEQLREKEQEAQRLREMVVHLRTKLESLQGVSAWSAMPPRATEAAAAPMEDVLGLLSPIKACPGSAKKPLHEPTSGRRAAAGRSRRVSLIPRPTTNTSTRRMSVLPPPQALHEDVPLAMDLGTGTSTGRKRHRMDVENAAGLATGHVAKRQVSSRNSLIPTASKDSVANRTRSRQSMAPQRQLRF